MSTSITKVALLGKGYIGEKIYDELVSAGFQVTVISRSNPDNAEHIQIVDYENEESIKQALVGQDAVVSTLSSKAWMHQYKLIDAAIAVRTIKHFIPSDYTALSTNPEVAHLPWYKDAVAIREYLQSRAKQSHMKWTVISTGPILGSVLNGSYMYNFQERTALITSNGDHKHSMTRRPTVGKAVAAVLSKSAELQSGPIYIHDVVTTQNEILQIAERLSGKTWSSQHLDGNEKLQEGVEAFKQFGADAPIFATFFVIHGTNFCGRYKTDWDGEGNKLLRLPMLPRCEFEALIATRLRGEVIDSGLSYNAALLRSELEAIGQLPL